MTDTKRTLVDNLQWSKLGANKIENDIINLEHTNLLVQMKLIDVTK